MLLFRILSYLGGYVTIILPEECLEKFINMATTRGIFLWGISSVGVDKVKLKVRLSGVQPLRHVARMTRCRFKIVERAGLPFLIVKSRRRKALLLGAFVFVFMLYLSSSFIWFVDIVGNKYISDQEVAKVARQAGLHRGVHKNSIDSGEIEKRIIDQIPELSWVGVYFDGTRANIKVVEKVLPPDQGRKGLYDIVAVKDGLIKEILVLQGQPLVMEGDTVTTGQVLISAEIPPPVKEEEEQQDEVSQEQPEEEQQVKFVHARGIVRARVWYEGYEEIPLEQKVVSYTGQEITKLCIKLGTKEIILMGPKEVPFADYDIDTASKRIPKWRNLNLPVEFITVKYLEKETTTKTYSRAQALRLAGERAIAALKNKLPADAKIINRQYEEVKGSGEEKLVRARALVETIEDIGTEKPHLLGRGGSGIIDGKHGSSGDHR